MGVGDAAGGLAEQRGGDAGGAPGGDDAGVEVGGHDFAAGVVVGVGHVDAEVAQVVGVFGFVVVAGEHDGVDVSAGVEDVGHGVGGVVPAGDDGPPVEHHSGSVLVAGGGAD